MIQPVITVPPHTSSHPSGQDTSLRKQFLAYIQSKKTCIIFSPHLDDAVLSTGSLLADMTKDKTIHVISIFTNSSSSHSPATTGLLAKAGFSNALIYFQARRHEDTTALKLLSPNIQIHHLGYTDSAWRTDASGVPYYPDMQHGETIIDPRENTLFQKIRSHLLSYMPIDKQTALFAPLGRGKHVDHQMLRDVIHSLFPRTIFYEDFPYSANYANEETFIKKNNLHTIQWNGHYEKKKQAIYAYISQYGSFFANGPLHLPLETYYFSKDSITL